MGVSGNYYINYRIGGPLVGTEGTFTAYLQGGTEGEAMAKLKQSNRIPCNKFNDVYITSMRKL